MKRQEFVDWLKENTLSGDDTISSIVARESRIEKTYGDLDLKITKRRFKDLIEKEFNYSKNDYENGIIPLHNIHINGNSYDGTASLRAALSLYYQFRFQRDDSYRKFLKFFGIKEKDFFEYGQKNLIFADSEKVHIQTKEILEALDKGTRTVYFRSYGRDGKGTELFNKLYKYLFPNTTVVADSSGNTIPKRNIQNLTGRRIGSDSQAGDTYNYVLSHIFGKTKNPIFFEGAFNFCLTLYAYECELVNGSLELSEHTEKKWASIDAIDKINFAAADTPIIKMTKENK